MASQALDFSQQAMASSGQVGQDGRPARLQMPRMMYGTAWKKERTADLVYLAIKAGFRGIDTAAMGKHYREDLVGEGIRRAIGEGIVRRQDLYIQTKFTPVTDAQAAFESQVPYDPTTPLATQIHDSVASSLRNLATIPGGDDSSEPYLDSVILHSPLPTAAATRDAWHSLVSLTPHPVRSLGISNVPAALLEELWPTTASAPPLRLPAVVQNRFCERAGLWDPAARAFCRDRGVSYQGFWILTANRELWQGGGGRAGGPAEFVSRVARGAGVSCAVALYALVLALGVAVLDGTTTAEHMAEDLEGVEKVALWRRAEGGKAVFDECLAAFEEWISPEAFGH